MIDDFIDWCQTFPNWIGFPMYLLVITLIISLPIIVVIFISPWLLLLIPVVWAILAIRWVVKNRT